MNYSTFLEVDADNGQVHYLIQSTPEHSLSKINKVVKSVTARRIFVEHPDVKKVLWGKFWSGDLSYRAWENIQARM